MKFLVVDDSSTMRRIVVNSLQRIGFTETVEAGDGQEALAKYDESVKFVITDWNMPNMNGIDLARSLRARDDGKTVPILMVTTRSVREDIVAAVEAGGNNYIVKPFTPQVLAGRGGRRGALDASQLAVDQAQRRLGVVQQGRAGRGRGHVGHPAATERSASIFSLRICGVNGLTM